MIINSDKSNNQRINTCVDMANAILKEPSFYNAIRRKVSFDMATASPSHISSKMQAAFPLIDCRVNTYYKKWTKANAYFMPSKPNDIFINRAKMNRTDASLVATIIHEWVHMVDKWDSSESFGHGDNSATGKQNTAPYWIDNVAEHFGQPDMTTEPDFNNNESSKIVVKYGFLGRVKAFFKRLF